MFGASIASNSIDTVLGLGFLFTNREIVSMLWQFEWYVPH